jgi:DNA gyrase subunit A
MTVLDNKNLGVVNVSLEKEMQSAYLEYAMSVIVSRAIPDVRDGLKLVHRRILYAMDLMDCAPNKAYKKSARIVGDVMGKYHPHGDSAIYDALVRMAQDFSMGEVLIEGQGNFGSIDDDPAASMRYTEARLAKLSATMLADISNNTVDFKDNYDGSEREPVVLPASFPNILVNGGEGIAVGMATSVPTHNLGEVIDVCLEYINNNNEITDDRICEIMPGPDFPTSGIIVGAAACHKAIRTGRGSVIVRGRAEIEELKNGKSMIVITEIPYQVVKTRLIEKIYELVKDKKIEGISDIRDESNKVGIRVVVELKKESYPDIVLNHLYKYTPLQTSVSYNMLLLNNMKPELMNVRQVVSSFVAFREEIVVKRVTFFLNQARDRAHVMIGLCVTVDSIDEIISIIRSSDDFADAKGKLLSKKWHASDDIKTLIELVSDKNNKVIDGKFSFTEEQVKAILEMRLSKLTGLERSRLVDEIKELGIDIKDKLDILHSRERLMTIIKDELINIKTLFAQPRRTEIIQSEGDEDEMEKFIPKEDIVITLTKNGFIKRSSLDEYRLQKRGGKGKKGMETNDDDFVKDVTIATTHDDILIFSVKGIVYKTKAYKLPISSGKGRALVNLISIPKDDSVASMLNVLNSENEYLIFITRNGNIRKSSFSDFANINTNGKIAMKLDDDDVLINVLVASDNHHIMIATHNGLAIRSPIADLRTIKSRNSDGVRGIKLSLGDYVVSGSVIHGVEIENEVRDQYLKIPFSKRKKINNDITDIDILDITSSLKDDNGNPKVNLDVSNIRNLALNEDMIVVITENGYGKRTSAYWYRITARGGKGVINVNVTKKTGNVVATFKANNNDELILITNSGQIIRCPVSQISAFGRNSQGVKIFDVESKGDKVVSVARISDCSDEPEQDVSSSELDGSEEE